MGSARAFVFWSGWVMALLASSSASQEAVRYEVLSRSGDSLIETSGMPAPYDVSPDGSRTAYVTRRGSRVVVVVDGRDGPAFNQLSQMRIARQLPMKGEFRSGAPAETETRQLFFTADGSKLVYIGVRNGKEHVVIVDREKARESPAFAKVQYVLLSPSGDGVAVVFQVEGDYNGRVWVDGFGLQDTFLGNPTGVVFSEDGEHFAYAGYREPAGAASRTHHTVLDGVAGPASIGAMSMQVMQRGLFHLEVGGEPKVVYAARAKKGAEYAIAFQDARGRVELGPPGFTGKSLAVSRDLSRYAFGINVPREQKNAQRGRVMNPYDAHVYHGGKKIAEHPKTRSDVLQAFTLSPDGSRLAYGALETHGEGATPVARLWVDGQGGELTYGFVQHVLFSPDSARLVAVVGSAGKFYVVEGATELGPYDEVSGLCFSPDSRQLAFAVRHGNEMALVVDGVEGERRHWVVGMSVAFHPDGQRVVSIQGTSNERFVVIGAESQLAPDVKPPILFSADGARWAAFVGTPRTTAVVVDGELLPAVPYGVEQGVLAFSPTGAHVVHAGYVQNSGPGGENSNVLFVDGVQGPAFSMHTPPHALSFPDERTVSLVAINDGQLKRITIDMPAVKSQAATASAATAEAGYGVLHEFTDVQPKRGQHGWFTVGADGVVYGVTGGGASNAGQIYRYDPAGGGFAVLHSFLGNKEGGQDPTSILMGADGKLYGTVSGGWRTKHPDSTGAVFRIGTDGSGFEVVRHFTRKQDFASPVLCAQDAEGRLYGVIVQNMQTVFGSLFRLDPGTGEHELLFEQNVVIEEGVPPMLGRCVDGGDGYLYGAAQMTLYRLPVAGGKPEVLHAFAGGKTDGQFANQPPRLGPDGKLYGIGEFGGQHGRSVLYRLGTDGSGYEVLHHFKADIAPLLTFHDGRLYVLQTSEDPQQRGLAAVTRLADGGGFEELGTMPLRSMGVFQLIPTPDGQLIGLSTQGAESLFRFNPVSAQVEELAVAEEAAPDRPAWPVEQVAFD